METSKKDEEIAVVPMASVVEGSIEKLDDSANRDFYGQSIPDSYRLKSAIVGKCMQDIGMGRFQWYLCLVAGCGGIVDNFWSQGIGTVQPAVALEFTDITRVTFSSIAYYAGMIVGATGWGITADLVGRKLAFNLTILTGGVFALAAGGANNFIGFCVLWSLIGTAAGGNVPVDNMMFLEFLPGSHQYLLTALSTFWMFGQLLVSLIGWGFIASYSCPTDVLPGECQREDNMGWRYVMFTLGSIAIAFAVIRIFIFRIPESPRFLLSKGRDAEAVAAVNYVARFNGQPEPLTLEMLQRVDLDLGLITSETTNHASTSTMKQVKESLSDFKSVNFRALFMTKKLAWHTSILWISWLTVGIAYPLYFNFLPTYLAQRFTQDSSLYLTYRNYCIQSAVGMAGPILAAMLIQTRLGRRHVMGIASIATGVFLFAYTTARSPTASLAFSSVTGFIGNLEYAVLFAFTPESIPAPHRGLGSGFAAMLLRVGGVVASLIGTYTDFSSAPIYVAGAMWMVVGFMAFLLPFETHDHAAI